MPSAPLAPDLLSTLVSRDLAVDADAARHPLMMSADLRHSGYKLVPVDVNLFPAGWNNLCHASLQAAAVGVAEWAKTHGRPTAKIALWAEHMTRNPAYVDNLHALQSMLQRLGAQTRIVVGDARIPTEGAMLPGARYDGVRVFAAIRRGNRLMTADGFDPDWIVSNDDFGGGVAAELLELAQPLDPAPEHGWHSRRKRDFFAVYDQVARDAAIRLGIDPWSLTLDTQAVSDVDFWNERGLDAVADAVDGVLRRTAAAYAERGIADAPFAVIKDEAGTFGMGVAVVDAAEVVRNPNRKLRQKMARGKGGRAITSVLVQEGVYTRDVIGRCVAEPVVMTAGGVSVGAFFRYHCGRAAHENLNAKGMVFARLCLDDDRTCPGCHRDGTRRTVYGWMARLVSLAAGREMAVRSGARATHETT